MPGNSEASERKRKRRSDDENRNLPYGIVPVNVTRMQITNIYGGEDMLDDPEVQQVLADIDDNEEGEA